MKHLHGIWGAGGGRGQRRLLCKVAIASNAQRATDHNLSWRKQQRKKKEIKTSAFNRQTPRKAFRINTTTTTATTATTTKTKHARDICRDVYIIMFIYLTCTHICIEFAPLRGQ